MCVGNLAFFWPGLPRFTALKLILYTVIHLDAVRRDIAGGVRQQSTASQMPKYELSKIVKCSKALRWKLYRLPIYKRLLSKKDKRPSRYTINWREAAVCSRALKSNMSLIVKGTTDLQPEQTSILRSHHINTQAHKSFTPVNSLCFYNFSMPSRSLWLHNIQAKIE